MHPALGHPEEQSPALQPWAPGTAIVRHIALEEVAIEVAHVALLLDRIRLLIRLAA